MEKLLTMESQIGIGRFKNRTVAELLESNRSEIFKLIRDKGLMFTDDVLEAAHIKKVVRDVQTKLVVVEHEKPSTKVLHKDTMSVQNIINGLNTITNSSKFYDTDSDSENEETLNE